MPDSLSPPSTMPRLLRWAAARFGTRPAIREHGWQIDFSGLDEARRRAAGAMHVAGIRRGERVAIWAPNRHEWILAALGAQSVGAILVPLNTRLKGAEAADILRRSGARLLFTVSEFAGNDYPALLAAQPLPGLERILRFGEPEWDAFLAAGAAVADRQLEALEAAVTPEDTLDLMFTSGTTGAPKGVVTAHGQNIRVFDTWGRTVGLSGEDRYLVINPFFHSFGYKAGWLAAIIRGACIYPVPSFDAGDALRRIQAERITMLPGPPTIYQSLLASPARADFDLASLRLAVTGAASVPVELIRRMRSELGFETVLTAYGLTESCGVVTISRAEDPPELIARSAGRAMPGVELQCVDGSGSPLPPGEPGEVRVRGYNVMRGYWEDPAATREALGADGWLRTGDVGILDANGYLRITDRLKDMFIVGGFNVYPAEVENLLCTHPCVAQAAVIGVPEPRLGEVGHAFVVCRPGAALPEEELIAWCRGAMANFKVPRRVEFLEALPLNAAGKVLKTALRARVPRGDAP